jgi:hypothetical protein
VAKAADSDGDTPTSHPGVLRSSGCADIAMSVRRIRASLAGLLTALALGVDAPRPGANSGIPVVRRAESRAENRRHAREAEAKEAAKSRVDKLVEDFRADRDRPLPPRPRASPNPKPRSSAKCSSRSRT